MSRCRILSLTPLLTVSLWASGGPQTAPATPPPATSPAPVLPEGGMKLEELLRRHHEAQGGLARLRALQARRIEGRTESAGQETFFTQLNARPDRCRIEMRVGDKKQVRVCDGRTGWTTGQDGSTIPLLPSEVAEMDADFDGPLVDPELKGHTLAYLGVQPFEGRSVHVVEARFVGGRVQRFLIDAATFLRVGLVNGTPGSEVTVSFSDYRSVDGVAVAHQIRVGSATLRLTSVSFPKSVREAEFQPPKK